MPKQYCGRYAHTPLIPLRHLPRGLLPALLLAVLANLPACAARNPVDGPAATVTPEHAAADAPAPTANNDDNDSIRRDATAGDAHAQLLMAERYLAGNGVPRNLVLAREWLEKSVAQDHAPALDVLSALHYRGIGTPVDYHKAKALMERAVEHRYLPAINNLAWFLATCPDASVRDGKRAVELLTPSMDQSAQMLDTLAAAWAENGDFERATEYQRMAVMALNGVEDPRFPSFIERLSSYGAGKPWRDPPPDAPRNTEKIP